MHIIHSESSEASEHVWVDELQSKIVDKLDQSACNVTVKLAAFRAVHDVPDNKLIYNAARNLLGQVLSADPPKEGI